MYKDDMILTYDNVLKFSKSIKFPQIALITFLNEVKTKTVASLEPTTHRLLTYPSTN